VWFKTFKSFNRCAPFNSTLGLRRIAAKKKRASFIGLKVLNEFNGGVRRGFGLYMCDAKEESW